MSLTVLVLLSATVAGYFDFRWHRVPNWLVGLTIVLSLAWHATVSGWSGLESSLAGLLLAVILLLPLFLLRGMGAGDVKFFGALGAALTYPHLLSILILSLFMAALMSVFVVLRKGEVRRTVRNLADLCGRWFRGRIGLHPLVHVDDPRAVVVPYTFAQALATWVFVLSRPGGWQ